KLVTHAGAAAWLSLAVAAMAAHGYWNQSVTATSTGRLADARAKRGEPAGQGGGGLTVEANGQPERLIVGGATAARFPRNAEEFDQMFNQIKNWGRWGPDDQLGTANLITDAKRKQAFALVKDRVTISLAHNLLTEAAPDNANPFEHTMNPGF